MTQSISLSGARNVSIKQIRAFLVVAATRNFSKAASELNVSASALSLTIRELERSVGRKLFERTTRAVAFTEAGSYFYPLAERLLSEFVTAIDDIAQFDAPSTTRLSVAAAQPVMNLLVAPALDGMTEAVPGLQMDLIESTTQEVIQGVTEGRYDLGVSTLWTKIDGVRAIPLADDRLGILMHAANPLAQSSGPLSWTEIREETIVSFMDGAAIKARVERDPNFGYMIDRARHHASSTNAMSALIRGGFGSAIVAAISARNVTGEPFVFRPLIDPPGWRSLYLLAAQDRPLSAPAEEMARRIVAALSVLRDEPNIRPRATLADLGMLADAA